MKLVMVRDIVAAVALGVALIVACWPEKKTAQDTHVSGFARVKRVFDGVLVGTSLLLALVVVYGVSPMQTIGTSMDTTIHDGNWLLMARTDYNPFVQPQRGDIVSAYWDDEDKMLLKRVVAVPGDTLQIMDNVVYINGTAMPEDYIKEPMQTEDLYVQLGEGEYFLMGDNRNISLDSRRIGTFPENDIYGVMIANLSEDF